MKKLFFLLIIISITCFVSAEFPRVILETPSTDTINVYSLNNLTDTNATTECGADEVLDGDGDCVSHSSWITNAVSNLINYLQGTTIYSTADSNYTNLTEFAVSQAGDNSSWNQSFADTLYATAGSGNASWNETYANTLYADISITGDNSSWNQTFADTLYATIGSGNASWNQTFADTIYSGIEWDYNQTTPAITYTDATNTSMTSWIDTTFLKIINMFTKIDIHNMIIGNKTEIYSTADSNYTNLTEFAVSQVGNTYNATYAGYADNVSRNYTLDTYTNWNIDWLSTYNSTYDANIDTNCTSEGSCPLITYDSELTYTIDTSAYVNCSGSEVFLGNGSCSTVLLTYTDTNASTECSDDEVLLGNSSCLNSTLFFDDTTVSDYYTQSAINNIIETNKTIIYSTANSNYSSILANISENNASWLSTYNSSYAGNLDTNASTECSNEEVLLGNTSCLDSGTFYDNTDTYAGWNNLTGIPHATPSDGDTTHFSLADEIYDWIISLGYWTGSTINSAISGNITAVYTSVFGAADGNYSAINTNINNAILGNKTEVYSTADNNYTNLTEFAVSQAGDNSSWNQTRAEELFYGQSDVNTMISGNISGVESDIYGAMSGNDSVWSNNTYYDQSLNKSEQVNFSNVQAGEFYGSGQYLTGVSGDNSSWNQTRADELYLQIDGSVNATDLNVTGTSWIGSGLLNGNIISNWITNAVNDLISYFTKTEVYNMMIGNKTEIFSTADSNYTNLTEFAVSQSGDNSSWNQTFATEYLYYLQSDVNTMISGNQTSTKTEVYGALDGNISAVNTNLNSAIAGNISGLISSTNVAWINETNTFTPAQTFSNNITVEGIKFEADATNHRIYDNESCLILEGDTSKLYIC